MHAAGRVPMARPRTEKPTHPPPCPLAHLSAYEISQSSSLLAPHMEHSEQGLLVASQEELEAFQRCFELSMMR